jgi:hypothetical protein
MTVGTAVPNKAELNAAKNTTLFKTSPHDTTLWVISKKKHTTEELFITNDYVIWWEIWFVCECCFKRI